MLFVIVGQLSSEDESVDIDLEFFFLCVCVLRSSPVCASFFFLQRTNAGMESAVAHRGKMVHTHTHIIYIYIYFSYYLNAYISMNA